VEAAAGDMEPETEKPQKEQTMMFFVFS